VTINCAARPELDRLAEPAFADRRSIRVVPTTIAEPGCVA
jgi:hypothetical protein